MFFSLRGIIYALSVVLQYKAGRSFKNTLCSLALMHKDGGVKGTIIIIKKTEINSFQHGHMYCR